jgi:hypothetical protein
MQPQTQDKAPRNWLDDDDFCDRSSKLIVRGKPAGASRRQKIVDPIPNKKKNRMRPCATSCATLSKNNDAKKF